MTFRDLYGQMTEAQQAELKAIQAEVGLERVDRADAEAAFFGGGDDSVEKSADGSVFGAFDVARIEREAGTRVADDRPFTREQMLDGVVLNAAVVLEDGVDVDEAKGRVQAAVDAAGLKLKVVDWRAASGVIGQFVMVIRGVLLLAIGIIFIVALVIINNSMLMATLERVREIGTLRAIGAQRRFVMAMVMLETLVLGLLSGAVGAGLGAALVGWMGDVGIPARNDILVFLFSGPRLHPTVGASNLLVALVVILIVSLISTWYPARIATRVQPVEAMREA
jgi:ABC-type lipoprotein release transport system permease subunit